MAVYPGAAGKHAVSTLRDRGGQGALLPAAGRQSDPGHRPETQRVSFVRATANRSDAVTVSLQRVLFNSSERG